MTNPGNGTHTVRIRGGAVLTGSVSLPADKSIAHRSAILAALSKGTSRIVNYPASADPQSTLSCLRQLGVEMDTQDGNLVVHGVGLHGLHAPADVLDCGNSGTTMRLLAGILAGQSFESVLVGDASLSGRPMKRIVDPLREMGADIRSTDGHSPLVIGPASSGLRALSYALPVPSAQVKSCVLLAGLFAEGETDVIEFIPSRDHTERMLRLPVVDLGDKRIISITGGQTIRAGTWSIPADFSAAAFFLAAGAMLPGSALILKGVGINPSRTAFMDVLRAMGADISIRKERTVCSETIADLHARASMLSGISVGGRLIPNLIDEIPILCAVAARAEGETVIRDAGELRHKESDRIAAITAGLRAMGADITESEDGMTIRGGRALSGADLDAHSDHRIAMALGIAALSASGESSLRGADVAAVSFPGFFETIDGLR